MLKQRNIVIIGVIYNTYPETIRYIKSLAKYSDTFLLILVDNSESDAPDSFHKELMKYEFIEHIKPGTNLGFLNHSFYHGVLPCRRHERVCSGPISRS